MMDMIEMWMLYLFWYLGVNVPCFLLHWFDKPNLFKKYQIILFLFPLLGIFYWMYLGWQIDKRLYK